MSRKKKVLIVLGVLLVLVLLDAWLVHFYTPKWGSPLFVSTSPDGRFAVSVYHNESLFSRRLMSMPGGAGGGAGTVVLRDTRTGKVLRRENTDYVDYGEPNVRWNPVTENVSIISVGVWELPRD